MKIKYLLSCIIIFYSFLLAQAQTITGTGGAIPASGNFYSFNLSVSGISPSVMNGSYGLKQVCLDLTHPNLNEVMIQLISPSGQKIEVVNDVPQGGANYTNTCFDGSATTSINSGTAPFTGQYRPTGYIGMLNDGSGANGNWQLQVKIWNFFGSAGTLNSWSLTFGASPLTPVVLTSSNLPIVVINSGGQEILDEPKRTMNMSIIYNGPGVRNNISDAPNNYNGKISIESRGSSSIQFQKKSFSLETIDNSDANLDVSLLGLPVEHDWVLYASYVDKSLIRNAISYDLARRMGNYASASKFVELVIDGQYQGVYALEEKIKRGKDRVDISKLSKTDNTGNDLTGGYIIRIDKTDGTEGGWYSDLGTASGGTDTIFFQYYYPKDTTITYQQKAYIQSYMHDFEQAIMSPDFANLETGYNKYIDVKSFVDYFIINELSKNVDAYKVSTYLYKDKDSKGGKLKIGPIWDMDLAWHNANFGNANFTTDWEYPQTSLVYDIPQWWGRLMQDPNFLNRLKCRWDQLKSNGIITPASINSKIDSLTTLLAEAQERNFTRWPILDANIWTNPTPVPTTFLGHAQDIKDWLNARYNWLDGAMPGVAINCFLSDETVTPNDFDLTVYPNPFIQQTTFSYYLKNEAEVSIKIYDILGKKVSTLKDDNQLPGEHLMNLDAKNLNAGVYLYQLIVGDQATSGKLILQK
jgi:subtilisin-like proprotein convertase family protein